MKLSFLTFLLATAAVQAQDKGVLFRPNAKLVEVLRDDSDLTSGGTFAGRSSTTDSIGGCTFQTWVDECDDIPGIRLGGRRVLEGDTLTVCSRQRRTQNCANCFENIGCRPTSSTTFSGETVVYRMEEASATENVTIALNFDDLEDLDEDLAIPAPECTQFCTNEEGTLDLGSFSAGDLSLEACRSSLLNDANTGTADWFVVNSNFDQECLRFEFDGCDFTDRDTCRSAAQALGLDTSGSGSFSFSSSSNLYQPGCYFYDLDSSFFTGQAYFGDHGTEDDKTRELSGTDPSDPKRLNCNTVLSNGNRFNINSSSARAAGAGGLVLVGTVLVGLWNVFFV